MKSRRTVLRTVGVAGVVGLAGCGGEDTTEAGETPTEGGDGSDETPTEDGSGSAETPTDDSGASGNWRATHADARHSSANTASNGPTSADSAETLYEPDGLVDLQSPPLVEDGQKFVLSNKKLFSVSASGELSWAFGIGGYVSPNDPMPAVRDGTVYVPVASTLAAVSGGGRDWAASFEHSVEYSPVTTEDAVYVSTRSEILSYAHDGTEQWSLSLDHDPGSPAIVGSTLYYFSTDPHQQSELYARDTSDGSLRWSEPVDTLSERVVIADGTVYAVKSSRDATKLVALSGADGSVEWESPSITESVIGPLEVAVAGDSVYLTTMNKLRAYSTEDGSPQWDGPYVGTGTNVFDPRVDSNSVYLFDGSAAVAVDRSTGDQRWSVPLGDGGALGYKGLSVADDSVYVTVSDKMLTIG